MTPIEVSELLAYISSAHPYATMTKQTVTVYADLLSDLDYEASKRAVRRLLAVSERIPPPAAIRREVAALAGRLAPSPAEALAEIQQRIANLTAGVEPAPWSNALVKNVVDSVGGLWAFRMSERPDTLRAHFLRAYEKAVEAHDKSVILSRGTLAVGSAHASNPTPQINAAETIDKADEANPIETEAR